MPTLLSQIQAFAQSFASDVLLAIRNASVEDILAQTTGAPAKRGPGRPRGSSSKKAASEPAPKKARKSGGRLPRRSGEQIAAALQDIVQLLKKNPKGLRAEHIRTSLGMIPKEMPRVLREGLTTKSLKAKGRKRATVYTAA